jgi:hypothetical protein
MELSPGLRTVVTQFEAAVRAHAVKEYYVSADGDINPVDQTDHDELAALVEDMDRKKQALLRKLKRIQMGGEYTDSEALKKLVRTMCRVIRNIQLAPEQAAVILATATSTTKVVQDVIDNRKPL